MIRKAADDGSGALSALVSTAVCIALLTVTLDVGRYFAAAAAVKSAADAAARCLLTTDSECYFEPARGTELRDWWEIDRRPQKVKWIDRYRYSARATEQRWRLTVPGYEVRTVRRPSLRYVAAEVPAGTMTVRYNRFERRVAHMRMNGERRVGHSVVAFTPAFVPQFPSWNEDYERLLDTAPAELWHPVTVEPPLSSGTPVAVALPFGSATVTAALAPAGRARLISPLIRVPVLNADPAVSCIDGSHPCSSVFGADRSSWRTSAAIAIKTFATVERAPGPVQLRWGAGDEPGLAIDVWTKNQLDAAPPGVEPPPSYTRCLGGRTWSNPLRPPFHYHLWLRGPVGSNGGPLSRAVCPEGSAHWPLIVERGGAFRVKGAVETSETSAPALVTLEARWLYEDFVSRAVTVESVEPFACESESELRREEPLPGPCPADTNCPPLEGILRSTCSRAIHAVPVCARPGDTIGDPSLFPTEDRVCMAERILLCDDATTAIAPHCPPVAGRQLCPPDVVRDHAPLLLDRTPADCPFAKPVDRTIACDDGAPDVVFRPDGDYGRVSQCPLLGAALVASNLRAEAVAATLRRDRHRVLALAESDLRWSAAIDHVPPRWIPTVSLPQWARPASNGEVVRPASVSFDLPQQWLRRRSQRPSVSDFGVVLSPVQHDAATIALIGESPISLEGRFPFTGEPELELPRISVSDARSGRCDGAALDVESMMRDRAARAFPAAVVPDVELELDATYEDSVVLRAEVSCGRNDNQSFATKRVLDLPLCAPVYEGQVRSDECGPRRYLGRFDSTSLPDGPAPCNLDPLRCVSTPHSSSVERPADHAATGVATRVAFAEISRRQGPVSADCGIAGCATVSIRRDGPGTFEVTAELRIALHHPLALFLRSDTLRARARSVGSAELPGLRPSGEEG